MALDHQIVICLDNDDDIAAEIKDEAFEIKSVDVPSSSNYKLQPSKQKRKYQNKPLQYLICQSCALAFSTHDGYCLHLNNCGNKDVTIAKCSHPGCKMVFCEESELAIHSVYDHNVGLDISDNDVNVPKAKTLGNNCVEKPQEESSEECIIETSIIDSLDVEESMEISMPQLQSSNIETPPNAYPKTSGGNDCKALYQCPHCSKLFNYKTSLIRHRKRCLKPELFECKKCNLSLSKRSYELHLSKKLCNSERVYIECSQANCNKSFMRHNHFWDHLRYDHGIYIKIEKRYFENMKEFYEWKYKEDNEKFVKTIRNSGGNKHRSGIRYHYFRCVFSYFRSMKTVKRRVHYTHCPARLLVKETKEGVFLTYYPFHNHKLDITNCRYFNKSKNNKLPLRKVESSSQLPLNATSSDQNISDGYKEDKIRKQDRVYIIVNSPSDINCKESSLEPGTNNEKLFNSQGQNSSPINANVASLDVPLNKSATANSPKVTNSILLKNISQTKNGGMDQVTSDTSHISLKDGIMSNSVSPTSSTVTSSDSLLRTNPLRNKVLLKNVLDNTVTESRVSTSTSTVTKNDSLLKTNPLRKNVSINCLPHTTNKISTKNVLHNKVSENNVPSRTSLFTNKDSAQMTQLSKYVPKNGFQHAANRSLLDNNEITMLDNSVTEINVSPSSYSVINNDSVLRTNPLRKNVSKNSFLHTPNNTLKNSLDKNVTENSLLGYNKVVPLKSDNLKNNVNINSKTLNDNLIEDLMRDHDYLQENPKITRKKLIKVRQHLELKLIELMRLIVLEEVTPLVPHFYSIISDLCKQAEGRLQDNENEINLEDCDTCKTKQSDSHLTHSQNSVNTITTVNTNENKKTIINISKPSSMSSYLKSRTSYSLEEKLNHKTEIELNTRETVNTNCKLKSDHQGLLKNGKHTETASTNAKHSVKRSFNNFNHLSESSSNDLKPLFENCDLKALSKSSSKLCQPLPERSSINVEIISASSPNNAKSLTSSNTSVKKSNLRSSILGMGLSFSSELSVENHSNLIMNVGTQHLTVVHLKSIDIYINDKEVSKLTKLCQVFKKGWLFDCVITAFLEVLASKFEDVVVVDPAVTFLVAHGIDYSQAFPEFKFSIESTLLLPLNHNNGHWALMVIKISSREIIFFDPKKGMDIHGYGHFIKPWMEMLNKTCNNQDDWTLVQPQRMLQNDSHSCGVYVCWYGQQYLYNNSYIEPFQPDVFRKHIYNTIIDHASALEINDSESNK